MLAHDFAMPLAERLTAQLLAGTPARDPVAVARQLLAIQGQDPRGARLAIRARTRGVSAADIDRALSDDRSLLITWLNRGTLHLVASEDYGWLHALTTPPLLVGTTRRLAQEGVSPADAERALATIARALAAEGPLDRNALRERIARAGVATAGQALVHLLVLASLRGSIVRGPMHGRQHAYVLVRDWVGEPTAIERASALAELARRYLRGHAPADDRDLARWAGLPLRDARAGLAAIARELRERPDGLLELATAPAPARLPAPRLLGAFDPVLLGWCSREQLLSPGAQRAVIAGGVFRPFALVRGRAAATWAIDRGRVELAPFAPLGERAESALRTDAQAVLRFLALA